MADIYSPKYSEKDVYYSQIIYHSESSNITDLIYDGGSIDASSSDSSTQNNNTQNIVYSGGEI